MARKKPVFRGYTEDEVCKIERGTYTLQFGGDFIIQDDSYTFNEREVTKLYESTMNNLLNLIADGSEKDRKFAIDLIGGLFVRPMRLH